MSRTSPPSPDLEKQSLVEIEETLAAIVRAWDAGDAASFARLFTDDATYVVYFGASYVGRQAIERAHVPLFERYGRGSRMRLEIRARRLLTSDTAVVLTEGGVGKSGRLPLDKVQTFTLVRTEAGWKCAAFQNTKKNQFFLWILGLLKMAPDKGFSPA
jgi:uncharacterized protein (TIGR02246 family)